MFPRRHAAHPAIVALNRISAMAAAWPPPIPVSDQSELDEALLCLAKERSDFTKYSKPILLFREN